MAKDRSFGSLLLLSIITFGIYTLHWFHFVITEIATRVKLDEFESLPEKTRMKFNIFLISSVLLIPFVIWLSILVLMQNEYNNDISTHFGLNAIIFFIVLVNQFFFGMFFLSFLKTIVAAQAISGITEVTDYNGIFKMYLINIFCLFTIFMIDVVGAIIYVADEFIGQIILVNRLFLSVGAVAFIIALYKTNYQINRIWQYSEGDNVL